MLFLFLICFVTFFSLFNSYQVLVFSDLFSLLGETFIIPSLASHLYLRVDFNTVDILKLTFVKKCQKNIYEFVLIQIQVL